MTDIDPRAGIELHPADGHVTVGVRPTPTAAHELSSRPICRY
jgi:hypothetical protein